MSTKTKVLGILSGVAFATSGIVFGSAHPASAAQLWNWSYSGPGVIGGSGTFITNDGPQPFLITGITGISEGSAITGLIAPGGFQGNDNILTNPTPPLQLSLNGGVSFSTLNSPQGINLRGSFLSVGFPPRNYFLIDTTPNAAKRVSFTATSVPEPLTILGTLTAVGFGTAFKRRLH